MSNPMPVTGAIAQRATQVNLTSEDFIRYPRQIVLDQVGEAGQRQLKAARILVVGAGGLGSPCLLYLAGAGVGTIGIADFDQIEISNLQRQILFAEDQEGHRKATMAQTRLKALNPLVHCVVHQEKVARDNVDSILQAYDLVIDGSDNFATRYLVNDAAIDLQMPYIYGSVQRFSGQVGVFYAPHGPCYRCLFPEPPPPKLIPNCSESGVLGSLAGTMGTLQATEALKLVLGIGKSLLGRILVYDGLLGDFTSYHLSRDPACVGCGSGERAQRSLPSIDSTPMCSTSSEAFPQVTSNQWKALVAGGQLPLALIDVRTAEEARRQGTVDLGGAPTLGLPLGILENYFELRSGNRGTMDSTALELVEKALRLIAEATQEHPVILYCKTGPRSRRAWELLSQLYAGKIDGKIQVLQGGHMEWLTGL